MITEIRIRINRADVFRSAQEITQVFSDALRKWREEEPRKERGEKLFHCPVCSSTASETYYTLKKYGKPRCTKCGVEMEEYDGQQFKKLRQKLADETIKISPQVVKSLLEVAAIHGIIDGAEAVVDRELLYIKPDYTPNEFRYDASTKRLEAYYYYYDLPQHVESLKALIKAAWRLGLGVLVHIEPSHMKMPLPYDDLPISRDLFNGIEIKMTAEELWGFARGHGGLY